MKIKQSAKKYNEGNECDWPIKLFHQHTNLAILTAKTFPIIQWGLIQQTLGCQFTVLPTELLRHVVVRILFRFYFPFLLIAFLPPANEVCGLRQGNVILFTEEVSVWCHFLSGWLVPCSILGIVSVRGCLSRRGVSVKDGGICPRGLCPGGSLSGRPPDSNPTYGDERAVRILLEYFLLSN